MTSLDFIMQSGTFSYYEKKTIEITEVIDLKEIEKEKLVMCSLLPEGSSEFCQRVPMSGG